MNTCKKHTMLLAATSACLFCADLAEATPITLFATGDTYITENDGYGGTASTHGDGAHVIIARGMEGFNQTFPIIKFDLTAFSGQTITSPTTDFVLNSKGGWLDTQSISIRESLVGWDESTASWINFGGSGFNEATHTGVNLTTRDVTFTGVGEPVLFSIPSSVVQHWIDTPASNNGLFLISNTARIQTDQSFWSREGGDGPSLAFEAIPEPGTMGLVGISSMGMLFIRRLRRRKVAGQSLFPIRIECDDHPFKESIEVPRTPFRFGATKAVASRFSGAKHTCLVWKKQCSDRFIDRLFVFDRARNAAKKSFKKKSLSCFDGFLALIMK